MTPQARSLLICAIMIVAAFATGIALWLAG
jgi:hypothetical protein